MKESWFGENFIIEHKFSYLMFNKKLCFVSTITKLVQKYIGRSKVNNTPLARSGICMSEVPESAGTKRGSSVSY